MKIKLIDFSGAGVCPVRKHDNDAGADVCVRETTVFYPQTTTKVPLGFGVELPDGLAGFIFPRSSMASMGLVCELPPIDSGYRGEVHAIVTNVGSDARQIKAGERIGQLVITPVILADFVTERGPERGAGAFGSTGK